MYIEGMYLDERLKELVAWKEKASGQQFRRLIETEIKYLKKIKSIPADFEEQGGNTSLLHPGTC